MPAHVVRRTALISLIPLALVLAACSSVGEPESQVEFGLADSDVTPETSTPSPEPPTNTPEPPTAEPEPTQTPTSTAEPPQEPTQAPTPEPTVPLTPTIPVGSTADLTASADLLGIEGLAEVIDVNKIRIGDFVSMTGVAPGVDIRLGRDGDFADAVAVVLKDITGDNYEGRSLTLTIPDEAFDGRTLNSIAIFCFDTGEIFDWASFE